MSITFGRRRHRGKVELKKTMMLLKKIRPESIGGGNGEAEEFSYFK